MKRKFTKLLAAIALLVFMTPSMVGWGQTTWEKATSIQVGDVVVLVTENSTTKKELTDFSNTSTVYGIGTDYTSTPAGTYTFEVVAGKSDGTFAFKHENSYLYWTSGNSLNVNSTLSNNTSWNVSIDGTNSKATITNAANNARQIWWNVSSPRFACYTDKTEGNSYYITTLYKQVSSGGNTPSITISGDDISNNAAGFVYNNTSNHVATVTCQNFSGTPNPTIGVYTDLECTTAYTGSDFSAAFAANSTTTVNYGFTTANNSTTEARTFYMRASVGEVHSNVVTVTQAKLPVTYTTIPTLLDGATDDETPVFVTFDDWVVSGVSTNGKNVFVTDGTNGFVIFDSNGSLGDDFEAGDILSGTAVPCTLLKYNGYAELKDLDAADLTFTDGGTVTAANITMDNLSGVNTGALFHYEHLTCSISSGSSPRYYLTDGTTTLQVYNALYAFDALTAGKTYNITGVYQQFNNTKEILPRSADDIEEVQVAATYTVTYDGNGADGGTTPVDDDSPYAEGATVTVLANTFTKTGHSFAWWSDKEDWTTVGANVYDPDDNTSNTFTINENTTLYAQWDVNSYGYTLNVTGADQDALASLSVGGIDLAPTDNIEYNAEVTVTVVVSNGYTYAISVKDADNNDVAFENEKFNMPSSSVTVTVTTALIQNHTITFYAGSGICETTSITESTGTEIQLPTAAPSTTCATEGWIFAGWATASVSETTTAPSLLTGTYTVTSDITLYAVYMFAESSEVMFNFEAIASANNWEDAKAYTEVTISPVTITATGGGNNGKYYVSDKTWRMYNGGTATIECENGNVIAVSSNPSISFTIANGVASNAFTATTKFKSITVTVLGGNGTYNSNPNCVGTVESPVFSPAAGTYNATQNVTITCATDGATIKYKTNENDDWTTYSTAISVSTTTTIWAKATKEGMDDSEVVSATYTIVEPFTSFTCTKATEIVSGKHYIITNNDGSMAMGYQKTNNRDAVAVTVSGNVVTVDSDDVFEFVIIGPDLDGFYTIYDVANLKYLYAASSSNNLLKIQNDINDNARWNITFDATDGFASIVATKSSNRNVMQFNSNLFSCYSDASYANVNLYAKDNEATVLYTKDDIAGYGSSQRGGYYLIASPVGQVTPVAGNGFLTNDYDLYAFDQSADEAKVWQNYKASPFNLVSGRGYLYANSGDNTVLTFEGMPYIGNGQVMLSYNDASDWKGWNLIGNPYATNATIPGNQSYYTLNTNRDELIAGESTTIGAMEGIFVKATAAGESVTFTPTRGNKGDTDLNSRVVLNLNGNHGVIDRAIVRFSEGGALPKFMMNPENTRIYIRQDNEDFAVLNSNGQGQMPVNFKAAADGTYTISVETENLEMNYLHLIDNKTGMDVDLLATPSYTFEGKRTDYASRFRLVFDANSSNIEMGDNFAFMSDGNIVITSEGEATLQVIDMLGRVVSTQTVNGNATINANGAKGVYVLQLVTENNIKTQKIVVR